MVPPKSSPCALLNALYSESSPGCVGLLYHNISNGFICFTKIRHSCFKDCQKTVFLLDAFPLHGSVIDMNEENETILFKN